MEISDAPMYTLTIGTLPMYAFTIGTDPIYIDIAVVLCVRILYILTGFTHVLLFLQT